jgi:hypothetical protein
MNRSRRSEFWGSPITASGISISVAALDANEPVIRAVHDAGASACDLVVEVSSNGEKS